MQPVSSATNKQNFIDAVDIIFSEVRHEVLETKIMQTFDFVLKFTDIDFYDRDYKGETKQHAIRNSKDNRRPSVKPNSKKLPKKLDYLLRIICRVSSINFFPVGVMEDSSCLEAEDRGHIGTLLWCHFKTLFEVSLWKRVLTIMESYIEEYDESTYIYRIYVRLNDLIDNKKPFSLSELIPQDIWDNYTSGTIPVQIKVYPTREMHVEEIIKFNGTEDTWITHQRAQRKVASYLRKVNVDSEELFDNIFTLVDGNDYFIGNKIFFEQHSNQTVKAENAEEEIVWLWMSALKPNNDALTTYRAFQTTDEKKRYAQYKEMFHMGAYRHIKKWKEQVQFLAAVAESNSYNTFETTLQGICTDLTTRKITHTNLRDLSVRKVDAALMFCYVIRNYIEQYKINQTTENYKVIATQVFEEANELLNDKSIVKDLREAHGSHKGRYEKFFNILMARLEPLDSGSILDIRKTLLLDARTRVHSSSLNPNAPFIIIDRTGEGSKSFMIREVNLITGDGFDKGHRDSTLSGADAANFFLQFSGDNQFWGNKRTFDPVTYADEYLAAIKTWYDRDNDDHVRAYLNTREFFKHVWQN